MKTQRKTLQLQIRISPEQKAAIVRYSRSSGMPLSQWVLTRIFPSAQEAFQGLMAELKDSADPKLILAQLHDLLKKATPEEFELMSAQSPSVSLSAYLSNYVAAMIEYTAVQKQRRVPSWTRQIPPLSAPVFVSDLKSLRLYLLTHSPAPFRRRNVFIDTTVGGRV